MRSILGENDKSTDAELSPPIQTLRNSVGVSLLVGVAYGAIFPYRTDYLGHFLAGFGGTLLLLATLLFLRHPLQWSAVAVTVVAVAVGFGAEATIFRLAIFDPVDFFNQSLGACLAAACVLGHPSSPVLTSMLMLFSLLILGLGFYFAFA